MKNRFNLDRMQLGGKLAPRQILARFNDELAQFRKRCREFLIYPERK